LEEVSDYYRARHKDKTPILIIDGLNNVEGENEDAMKSLQYMAKYLSKKQMILILGCSDGSTTECIYRQHVGSDSRYDVCVPPCSDEEIKTYLDKLEKEVKVDNQKFRKIAEELKQNVIGNFDINSFNSSRKFFRPDAQILSGLRT
jgi:hypothetical protein